MEPMVADSLKPTLQVEMRLLAACVLLAPLILALSFLSDPTGGVPGSDPHVVQSFRAASSLQVQLFLWTNTAVTYLFAPSFIGLGLLARRRSPKLALLGTVLGLIGSLPWALFVGTEAVSYHLATAASDAGFARLRDAVSAEGPVALLQVSWIVGHLAGYVLLAVALARGRVVPLWAAVLLACVVVQGASYPTHVGAFQILAFTLVFVGSIPAALRLWRDDVTPRGSRPAA